MLTSKNEVENPLMLHLSKLKDTSAENFEPLDSSENLITVQVFSSIEAISDLVNGQLFSDAAEDLGQQVAEDKLEAPESDTKQNCGKLPAEEGSATRIREPVAEQVVKTLNPKVVKLVEPAKTASFSTSLKHKFSPICDKGEIAKDVNNPNPPFRQLKIPEYPLKQRVFVVPKTLLAEEGDMKKSSSKVSRPSKDDADTRPPKGPRAAPLRQVSVAGEGRLPRVVQEIRSGPVLRREMPYPKVPEKRVKCLTCQRGFSPLRIQTHQRICQKVFGKKRPVFDSRSKRLAHFGIYLYTSSLPELPHRHATRWREQHSSLISALRHGRAAQRQIARGARVSDLPPPPYDDHPEMVSCRHCGRRFSPSVAERHIPRCAEIRSNKSPYLWERPPWR